MEEELNEEVSEEVDPLDDPPHSEDFDTDNSSNYEQGEEIEQVAISDSNYDYEQFTILLENNQTLLTDIYNLLFDVSTIFLGLVCGALIAYPFLKQVVKW